MTDERRPFQQRAAQSSAATRVRLFTLRVRRRLTAKFHDVRVRLEDRFGWSGAGEPIVAGRFLPWSPLAAVPGDEKLLPWAAPGLWDEPACAALGDAAARHELFLLAPHAVGVDAADDGHARSRIATLAAELPPQDVAAYRPIDWHCDFHSGYRWDANELYLDVRIAPVAGAEIKMPRELSRFQHVGALARGPLVRGATEFMLQSLDWIASNPQRRGVNWACTMDVALRAVNWVWALRLFEPVLRDFPRALGSVAGSLQQHGRHIENNLEYYEECTSNHYLSNVAGLLYIGAAFPEFPESDRWLLFGLQELVSEMHRQVYPDGMSYEASTHYHRLVAELFASCAGLAERMPAARLERLRRFDPGTHRMTPRLRPPEASGLRLSGGRVLPQAFYERLSKMAEITVALTKPNGLLPQFGDNDSGRVHKLMPHPADDVRDHRHLAAVVGELVGRDDLVAAGRTAAAEGALIGGGIATPLTCAATPLRNCEGTTLFPDAGIAVLRRADAYVAVTCGPNGQGGRGGHGHNDKLSFELNVAGHDVVVDGGCPCYTSQPAVRNRFRSTAAHSTISVPGREQDEWAPGPAGLFRLPERSKPRLAVLEDGRVTGEHTGFGAPHIRVFRLEDDGLYIDDILDLACERHLIFNLDPDVACEDMSAEEDGVLFSLLHADGMRLRVRITGVNDPAVGEGCFSVGYGVPRPTRNIRARMSGPRCRTEIRWVSR